MKLVTLPNGSPDGQLALASRDLHVCVAIPDIASTLQAALEDWDRCEPLLRARSKELETGNINGQRPFDSSVAMAPIPRARQWLDGSTFVSHAELMTAVFKVDPLPQDRPLMYQGMADFFYGPNQDVLMSDEAHGIDFEGEFGVIVSEVPMGVSAADAGQYIRLLVQINDWSLRALGPIEMETGFGWIQAKPACSIAPAAITPDELGAAWRDNRIDLDLVVEWNGRHFGRVNAFAMGFSFADLIAHAARTRRLCAGTIIGSGTVSNANFRDVGSSCIAERRGIEILDTGNPTTPYMRFGDKVRMEAQTSSGEAPFGAIHQKVVSA